MATTDAASAYDRIETSGGPVGIWRLDRVLDAGRVARLPYVVRIFLENVLRRLGDGAETAHLEALANWPGEAPVEFPFFPARVVLQDFTGVPCVADLAAMRSAVDRLGGKPSRVNPIIAADLVIDHSVLVDFFGGRDSFQRNVEMEYVRNRERYAFLRWAQRSFNDMTIVPPGAGIVHQVNLEFLARAVVAGERNGEAIAYPDTLVGTDSHTTMIGGLGVLGWGVGGIEAEAAMLGEPVTMLTPVVVGVRLDGALPTGSTATDLVLAITELLREHGVVGKFVEFHGEGLASLSVPDRATISNMSPEYGATEGVFPIDDQTLAYLRSTGRDADLVDLVERYTKAQGLFHEAGASHPAYSESLTFDLGSVEPSLAGPRRPQDRAGLDDLPRVFFDELSAVRGVHPEGNDSSVPEPPVRRSVTMKDTGAEVSDGSVVIAAITSCTNTSNPTVMVGAGLLARNAAARGLRVSPAVKTSLAPGSPVVEDYLRRAGLLEELERLNFYLVGFGCTTCIGNSGPLPDEVARAIDDEDLATAAVLSGNRNFEGRIHPQVRMAFLASPPLVVAYALAGTVDIDLTTDPLGTGSDGEPVFLRDVWPPADEILSTIEASMDADSYRSRFKTITQGDEQWRSLPVPEGELYDWDPSSTYIAEPPFLADAGLEPAPVRDVTGSRVLVFVGDSVTTDHISPAGSIKANSPAGQFLAARGVPPEKLHSYGARRGNHEVMVRGTFANIRLRNKLVPGTEGGVTAHLPDGEQMTIFDASERYRSDGVPLLVLAGKEYGAGSSRDWAAKGTALLGVRAVIAESYERIHRSNLVQMGLLPLEFPPGTSADRLGLNGREVFDVVGVAGVTPGGTLPVLARRDDGTEVRFDARVRIDTPTELHYYRQGGILPAVLRTMLASA
ncbi:MAG: aconitate hydratase AcnA [Actinobacteria bacterium]|nr:MAG: aconitate hydratase AcnA [Actinomycetota bacterium]